MRGIETHPDIPFAGFHGQLQYSVRLGYTRDVARHRECNSYSGPSDENFVEGLHCAFDARYVSVVQTNGATIPICEVQISGRKIGMEITE
jgi:hypothetical protein